MVGLDVVTGFAAVVGAFAAIIAAIVGIMNQRTTSKAQEPLFKLIRRDSIVGDSKTAIEVSHPDKPIRECAVLYNGEPLLVDGADPNQHEDFIYTQGSALFRIPAKIEDENALIIVKDGKKQIHEPIKLKNIPHA